MCSSFCMPSLALGAPYFHTLQARTLSLLSHSMSDSYHFPSPITTSPLPNLSPAFLRTSIRRASPITWTAERYLISIYMPDCCLEPQTPQSLGWSFLKAWPSRTIIDNSYRALTDARFSSHPVTNPSLPSRAHRQTLNKPSGKSQQDPPLSHAHSSPSIHPWLQHPRALP